MNLGTLLLNTDNETQIGLYFIDESDFKLVEIICGNLGFLLHYEIDRIRRFLNKRVIRVYLENNILNIVMNDDIIYFDYYDEFGVELD